jgi:hypothetical protein
LRLSEQTVQNVPGTWNIWTGMVNKAPIINYVRSERDDTFELEFDLLDFFRDAEQRQLDIPGTHILSVAVGFEIWNGPVTNLKSVDFYVDAQSDVQSGAPGEDGGQSSAEGDAGLR